MIYDILILAAKKDFNNLKYLFDSLVYLKPSYNKVYCVCPEYPETQIEGIDYILEKDVLAPRLPRTRSSWVYQQYIKLFQQITVDNYLVIDADIILNKDVEIITENTPNFLIGRTTINTPFFKWYKQMFELDRSFNESFISEIMFFDRKIINEMIPDKEAFIEKSNSIITTDCFLSEYETYGNYVHTNHRAMYNYCSVKISPKFLFEKFKGSLEEFIALQKDSIFDILTITS